MSESPSVPVSVEQMQQIAFQSGKDGSQEYISTIVKKVLFITSNAVLFVVNLLVLILNWNRI